MRKLVKIGCLIGLLFLGISCTKKVEPVPDDEVESKSLLEQLKEVVSEYGLSFEDQMSAYEDDIQEKGLTSLYIAGDSDTRICYFSYHDQDLAQEAYTKDRDIFQNDNQATLIGEKTYEDYCIMYSSQTYISDEVEVTLPKTFYTYSILKDRFVVVIVSSDATLANEILQACQFEYE